MPLVRTFILTFLVFLLVHHLFFS
ncbi:BH1919 [Halalkalibacterium halodurans C-125]|uniref:BH1919 protein n=1 Tax=Halalkalibacterium halodurans (strain ATCC BAA-125 / DSM 18197 / FERM 7344 / JCM 9153 / C-125) TaxID=272558 RepID=Q9KBK7_HALH5|nr:BH1919 [Halalkalibacterium halodurans C-125]